MGLLGDAVESAGKQKMRGLLDNIAEKFATAQRNAALPIEQGGLGLGLGNTAMERAKAMGMIGTSDARKFKADILQEIRRAARDNPDDVFALRSLHDAEQALPPGSKMEPSYNWDDGNIDLNDPLSGTAGFGVAFDSRQNNPDDAFARVVAYSVGANKRRVGVIKGSGLGSHDMPEYGASSVEDAELLKSFSQPESLQGIYNERNVAKALDRAPRRSINAAFDPLLKNSSDILASAAPIAVGLGAGSIGLLSTPEAQANTLDAQNKLASMGQSGLLGDVGSIKPVEHPWLDAAANAIDKYAVTPIPFMEHPLSGTSNLLRNFGRQRPAFNRFTDALGASLDYF